MLLKPNPVSSAQLYWDRDHSRFTAAMSEIGGFGRVWDDSADEGFTLESRYPGRPDVVMVVTHTERDRDGDIAWWDLKPADSRPGSFLAARIYND